MSTIAPRIYVSAALKESQRALSVIRELERRGASIVLDWPTELARALHDDPERPRSWAWMRLDAINHADAVVVLLGPPCEYRDREHGAALLRKSRGEMVHLITVGQAPHAWDDLGRRVESDLDAVRFLTRGLRSPPSLGEAAIALCREILTVRQHWLQPEDSRAAARLSIDAYELMGRKNNLGTSEMLIATARLLQVVIDATPGGSISDLARYRVESLIGVIERAILDGAYIES